MSYWEGPSRWINALLLFILGFLGLHAFFLLLNAQESNLIVGLVGAIGGFFLAPFEGMFAGQSSLVTILIAVLGYCLLAGIALAITKSVQTSRREAGQRGRGEQLREDDRALAGEPYEDRTQRL